MVGLCACALLAACCTAPPAGSGVLGGGVFCLAVSTLELSALHASCFVRTFLSFARAAAPQGPLAAQGIAPRLLSAPALHQFRTVIPSSDLELRSSCVAPTLRLDEAKQAGLAWQPKHKHQRLCCPPLSYTYMPDIPLEPGHC